MGEGEAMMNYGAVVQATKTLRALFGERISFTISTVGLLPGLRKLIKEEFGPWVTLQLSLHAPNDALRTKFVPVTGQLSETIRLAREYAEKTRRDPASPSKVCVNYILVQGRNDSVAHAEELAKLLDPRCFYVKLSRLNLLKGSDLKPSSRRARNRFEQVLKDRGYTVKHFLSGGTIIGSGCGQMIGDTI
jgi:23S rRNA (adenine2503-C2)-methyltransferase